MRRKLKAHQKALVAMVVFITAGLLLAAGVWAYDTAQKDQIAPGVTVGGVDIGGRSVEDARDVIEEQVVDPLAKPVVVKYEGETYRLTPKQLETTADLSGMLDEATELSREGGLVERVSRYVQGSTVDADIEPRVAYSEEAIDEFIAKLAEDINKDAQDASITPSTTELIPTPGENGIALREGKMRALITNEVEEPGAGKRVQAKVEVTRPEITTKEPAEAYPT